MKRYGYIRESSELTISEQMTQLACYDCDFLWIDKGKKNSDKELKKLLSSCVEAAKKEKLMIVIANLTVFEKTLKQFLPIITYLKLNHIELVSLDEGINTEETMDVLTVVSAVQDMDEKVKSKLTKDALRLKKEEGISLGRPKIAEETIERIYHLYKQHYSLREISDLTEVSLGSVHKYIKNYRGSK
ncbi:recombinase family protein [Vagococcus sp. DIV0080]|uniref:Recombinase family protein n=1 Tax=Candidatus Vagococcus giribetii TaxID=2230876 RepID=A0ABS3HUP2_9ENTE|nr:recombinase family protein [Vagococcus sp. DIV0080]MBO0477386.1 recombinase family protein [Vagococcus sp. DIV0080]